MPEPTGPASNGPAKHQRMKRLLKMLWREFMRRRMQRTLHKHPDIPLQKAAALWSLSDLIYLGPAGAAARRLPEWELYRRYCASPTPTDEALQALLSHPSPAVAGYAFEILIARDSALLSAALDTLRPRTSEVSSIVGSFVGYQELGSYAKNRYEAVKGAPVSGP